MPAQDDDHLPPKLRETARLLRACRAPATPLQLEGRWRRLQPQREDAGERSSPAQGGDAAGAGVPTV